MIWVDATCSGSQLISLLLGIDKYAKDLNLLSSNKNEIPGDYYSKINEEFIIFINNKSKEKNLLLEQNKEKEKVEEVVHL